ncbi:UNVERIFIED_CONTAM: hypothetical protein FKN15_001101 [Acipenser sinensis]
MELQKDMYAFLCDREIVDEVIQEMKTHKIDSSAVLLIEDTSLEKYLPALGDRVALRSYCDNHAEKTSSDSKIVPSRKNVLFEKLRKKMKLKPSLTATEDSSDDDKHSQCCDRKLGNKHAAKSTRKIKIRWLHNAGTTVASANARLSNITAVPRPQSCSLFVSTTAGTTVASANARLSITLQLSPDHSLSPSSPPIQQLANSPQPAQLSPTQQNADVRILTLHRVIILQDMLGEFKDSNILNASLTIEFVDEAGSDVSGISRDAYSAFWEAFFQNFAEEEYERVPALYPEYGKEEWEAVGRILLKGYLDQSYFPIQLSLAFAVGLVYGESEITPRILMVSFLRYIAPFEKDIITSALDGSIGADDQDELLDILSRMGCHTVPSHDSMKGTILQVAHKQLMQEPKYALEVMADVTRSTSQKLLPEVSNLEALYEAKKPTVKQVLNMINAEVQNAAQNKTMNFLKQFIRTLDNGRLQIMEVTGADMLCVEKIDIQFTDIRGLQQRPVAHTCGPLLEVPCT